MQEEIVLRRIEQGVFIITLNRPEKRNALNDELISALKRALDDAAADVKSASVMIQGAGKDFCSGADLASLEKIASASLEENLLDARNLADLFLKIRSIEKPVIAAVHGKALAGGCGLATSCDLIVSSESAVFGYPEVKIGFVPAIVMAFLRRNVSEKKAFELATSGREFTAAEAASVGLVNRIFEDAKFLDESMKFSAEYAKVSRSAVAMTKRLLYKIDYADLLSAVNDGIAVNARARMSEDCQNGIRRFLEKRL
ncbi:MAG: methylglutaconyl-CoA hydratase [Blastocatellia bacterium]